MLQAVTLCSCAINSDAALSGSVAAAALQLLSNLCRADGAVVDTTTPLLKSLLRMPACHGPAAVGELCAAMSAAIRQTPAAGVGVYRHVYRHAFRHVRRHATQIGALAYVQICNRHTFRKTCF